MKEMCPKCRTWYSVSCQRDRTKVFICADCSGRQLEMINKKKYIPIYDRRGYARVYGWGGMPDALSLL